MWGFVILTTSRLGGPPHDPWPVVIWTLGMLGFVAIVGGAATIANHVEDQRHNPGGHDPGARRSDHELDAPGD